IGASVYPRWINVGLYGAITSARTAVTMINTTTLSATTPRGFFRIIHRIRLPLVRAFLTGEFDANPAPIVVLSAAISDSFPVGRLRIADARIQHGITQIDQQ